MKVKWSTRCVTKTTVFRSKNCHPPGNCLYPPTINDLSHRALSHFLCYCVTRHSLYQPQLKVGPSFYFKLLTYTSTEPSVVILSISYLTRLRSQQYSVIYNTPGPLLYVGCLILASIVLEDRPFTIKSWSKLSDYSPYEINQTVQNIMKSLDYRFNIMSPSIFLRLERTILNYFCVVPHNHTKRHPYYVKKPNYLPSAKLVKF